ncbi:MULTISPECIES: methyltransferase domain-containing protein [unclassified Microcoleus]|nr:MULTISPECIES: methyltransferase domain-containing protein [unclassified Microcoleus]MCC3411339.1 methyltransferase domain-containing protein [Microcoleus sp. PH2017_02_FOX_O_A]MCC3465749.1 methyltransferase domain-containing protein [Microcoleus sp. PH2017_06_SFM_O_A]MCC3490890.1 methyltransferase domain-containing protein [Microcoleus sp. PH2017_16_JOR_D_A]MCC3517347.1 methyltransferase domain-containing protein [Microcoleus sp. PH2017_18_LLB_O_A]MCC3534454.1 methyltransferase domain-conta
MQVRRDIAFKYLSGKGIEVGALHAPLEVPDSVKVSYVDRMSVSDLRKQYPELNGTNLIEADIVDNGETLSSIADNSWDFVIANHMIEHCQNPIGALENFLRVLKPGGIVYMGVPDKRYIFDVDRPMTTLDHLIRDYKEGPEWSKVSHYEEYVRLVEKFPQEQILARQQALIEIDYSIHFHVWTSETFSELLFYSQKHLGFDFTIELFQQNSIEIVMILRKIANSNPT